MRSSNPVLSRPDAFRVSTDELEQMYAAPQRMTVDDVVMRTAMLLVVAAGTAVVGWMYASPALVLGALVVGLVLALVATFQSLPKPALVLAYAAVEGVFLGGISRWYETMYEGIVMHAVLATAACFAGVLVAYRTGLVKATPRFRKIIISSMIGIGILYLVNFVMSMFGGGLGVINGSGALSIAFSVFVVAIAALSFVLDFDLIEEAIRGGAPERFGWKAAFGLVVGLVWLYLELLRLLSKLRD